MPIPKYPLGTFALKLNKSYEAKGTNWLKLSSTADPRHLDLGFSGREQQILGYDLYRHFVEPWQRDQEFRNAPPPKKEDVISRMLPEYAARAAQELGKKLGPTPGKVRPGFSASEDGSMEPDQKFYQHGSIDVRDLAKGVSFLWVKGSALVKKLSTPKQPIHCIFLSAPYQPPPFCPTPETTIGKINLDPSPGLQLRLIRVEQGDFVVCSPGR